jgi:uncharacterized protein (TIGR02231 family)
VNVSGQEPTLAPWRVTEKIPPAPMLRAAIPVAYSSGMGKRKSKDDFAPEEMEIEEMAASVVEPAAQEDFFIQEAAVPETKTTSVVFRIPKKSAINCDNKEHRVSIILFEFAARFHYSSVPKLNPLAYLKAQVTNTTEYPLLEGPANVYFDNSFVATAQMQLVAPGEEFWTSLGIDEAIKIKRKFIKKYQSQEGVFTKTNKFIFEYLIEITNNKKTEEDIKITDQIPISGRDKIIVTLMKPEYKQDSESLKKNELNMVEWFFKMKASEKKSIPFQFSVEYPRDMRISGL